MLIALGVIVAVFTIVLAIGALTGRVKATSCCSIADPRRDLRMQDAFADPGASRPPSGSESVSY
jgi:hypothetical protein